MKATALYEGSYSVDASKKFIPFDSSIHQASERPASLFIFIQPFLIKTSKDLILVDTGLGYSNENGDLILHQNVKKAGYQPKDVTKVLMSHLHFDHSGGMIYDQNGNLTVSFPDAEYFIQRGEWENAYSKISSSYKTEIFDVMQRSGQVNFLDGNGAINDEISYEVTGGHTAFHQVFYIKEDDETYFFGGDIAPEPEQFQRKFIAKYDLDGRKSMVLRAEFSEKAINGNWICLFYHAKSKAIAKVKYRENQILIEEFKP